MTWPLPAALLRVISGYDLWVLASTGSCWLHDHHRARRALTVAVVYSALVALSGSAAVAAQQDGSVVSSWLPVSGLADTRGIPIEQYLTLPLDRGSLTNPVMSFLALGTDFLWGAHMVFVMIVLNMIRFVISFGWVDPVVAPVEALATQISALFVAAGYVPMALSAAGLAVGVLLMRGRYGRATSELLVVATLAAVLVGPLSNPVSLLAGEGGLLTSVQQSSAEIVLELTNDGQLPAEGTGEPLGPEQVISQTLIAETVDTFVRAPAQMIAFGSLLDGGCEDIYDEQLRAREPLDVTDESMRQAMGSCDHRIKTFIGSALAVKLGVQIVVQAGGVGLLVLLGTVCGMLLLLVAVALYNGARAAVTGFLALLPGSTRTGFVDALLQAALSVVLIPFVLVFLIVLMRIINRLMDTTASDLLVMMITVDLLIVVGVILLLRMRQHAMDKARKLAQRLATLGTGHHVTPRPSRFSTTMHQLEPWAREIAVRTMLSPRPSPNSRPPAPWPGPGPRPDTRPGTDPGSAPAPGGPRSLPPGGPPPARIMGRPRPLALTMGLGPGPIHPYGPGHPHGPGHPSPPTPVPAPRKPPRPGPGAAAALAIPEHAARLGAALTMGAKIAAAVPGAGTATAATMATAGKGLSAVARAGKATRTAATQTATAAPTTRTHPTPTREPVPAPKAPQLIRPATTNPVPSPRPDRLPPTAPPPTPTPARSAPVNPAPPNRRAPAMSTAATRAELDARLAAARARTATGS